jgi:hypothetical protein
VIAIIDRTKVNTAMYVTYGEQGVSTWDVGRMAKRRHCVLLKASAPLHVRWTKLTGDFSILSVLFVYFAGKVGFERGTWRW